MTRGSGSGEPGAGSVGGTCMVAVARALAAPYLQERWLGHFGSGQSSIAVAAVLGGECLQEAACGLCQQGWWWWYTVAGSVGDRSLANTRQ